MGGPRKRGPGPLPPPSVPVGGTPWLIGGFERVFANTRGPINALGPVECCFVAGKSVLENHVAES